jgi:hypothetical protein
VPTTFVGLSILIILLGPGFCYVAARERRYPSRQQSAFRESVQIAAASIVLNLLTLLAFWAARSLWSSATPNLGRLVAHPGAYWLDHYRLVIGWSIGLFATACTVGFLVGAIAPARKSGIHASAWWQMFEDFPKAEKWVGCEMDDGSYVSGQLYSYSIEAEETENRELVIRDPKYRGPEDTEVQGLGADLTVVSAHHIRFLSVNYLDGQPPLDQTALRDRLRASWTALRGTGNGSEAPQDEGLTVS